jgi:hypothetical protein
MNDVLFIRGGITDSRIRSSHVSYLIGATKDR